MKEEGVVDLEEVDLGIAGDDGKGGWRAAREVELGAAVLLQTGDGGGLAGYGLIVGVEDGRGTTAKGVIAVEVVRQVAMIVVEEELCARLEGVVSGG